MHWRQLWMRMHVTTSKELECKCHSHQIVRCIFSHHSVKQVSVECLLRLTFTSNRQRLGNLLSNPINLPTLLVSVRKMFYKLKLCTTSLTLQGGGELMSLKTLRSHTWLLWAVFATNINSMWKFNFFPTSATFPEILLNASDKKKVNNHKKIPSC